ncbi:LysR family transcriptional regulator [Sphingobium wenxiniae]|uniref:LysR family transcriptional regulator n=1 Tax=Sphingobium wenxiniae (strain DSM 21828 / CGMCC 1.7748 / JZ-1) TaxID=595605 RepID=UPI00092710A5|nr:LysR family transcriptional regulator [Sphingobium wenxiniae]OJY63095.1 MAG: LysR family transcriptional regulator [Sphingobium sp. 66-54]
MIELRQLRYLIAAADAGSFSRAARNINIKQATLSRHILEIEKRLGMALFDRKTRGATLTPNGRTYLRTAQRIVKEFEELNAWVWATNNGVAGKLTVGFYTSFSAGNLRATLSEFSHQFPEVKLSGFERDRDMLLAGIENGLLDIVIMIGDATYSGLASRSFWSERILVALPESHPLAGRQRVHWTDLTGERFLLTEQDPGPETRNMLLGKLGMPGYSPEIDMDDIRRDTVLSVIALGGHISIVAESALGIHVPGVVFREVHETNGHTRIGFSGYWREDNENPALRRFLEFVTARYSMPSVPGPQPPFQQPGKEPS